MTKPDLLAIAIEERGDLAHLSDPQRLRHLRLLRTVKVRMDREYARPLNVEALAQGVHLSAAHLSREFKKAYGKSPYSYLMSRRIERAMMLLRRGDMTITDICFAVGFNSLGTFSTRFTERVGMPPSSYKKQPPGPWNGPPGEAHQPPDPSEIEKRPAMAIPDVTRTDLEED